MMTDDTWRVARLPLPQRLLGKAMAWGYRLIGKHRYDDFRLEWVYGLPFMVTPSVFNPKVPRTGQFFASHIDSTLVSRESEILDMGTGSGVCAVFAANHAQRVVAVDILFDYLRDKSSIVKTCAMQGLAGLAAQDAALKAKVLPLLKELTDVGTPAMRARGRKLLAGLVE